MKKLMQNRIFLSTIAFLLGGATVWGTTQFIGKKRHQNIVMADLKTQDKDDPFFDDDFFEDSAGGNPFAQMKKLQSQMMNRMRLGSSGALGSVEDSSQREDDKYVYFDIPLNDMSPENFKVEVKNGEVSISGRLEQKENQNGNSQTSISRFDRQFPVPPGTDGEKFEMGQEGQKLVLKFPKIG